MAALFGAIADDFTGATDLAGLLARSGARVSLRIGVPKEPESDPAPFEVIALKIRTEPVSQAVEQALAALDWLQGAGVTRFFWKYCSTFDSTPDGNIGPVAEALMHKLGAKQTTYCPAFPENGRSIFMGNLFVGQQLLAESPMKDHPLTPMRDSNLMRLLQPQVTGEVGLVDRLTVANGATALRKALDTGPRHVILDAVANSDLTTIAKACRDELLMTGGSAVAMPLPDLYRKDGLLNDDGAETSFNPPAGKGIILSGSCSAMTQAQVKAYQKIGPSFRLNPIELNSGGIEPVLEWLGAQTTTPLVYATAAPDQVRAAQEQLGTEKAGALIEDTLAQIAVAARGMGVRRFVVAGGETSGAVTKALAVSRLDIGPEIAPGVPWCSAQSGGEKVALALKSGNFGNEDFFQTAMQMVDVT